MRHPLVWSVPLTVLLVVVLMPVNDGFYEMWINYDPQGAEQQWEWRYNRQVMRRTSGMLCGHVLAFVVGVLTARRHRQAVALAVAALSGTVLAAVTIAVAWPLAGDLFRVPGAEVFRAPGVPYWALLTAYPLYALAGVGLGALLVGARISRLAGIAVILGWPAAGMAGLIQDDGLGFPSVLLWLVPPLAAATAIGMASLSRDVWVPSSVPPGDWGQEAAVALIGGLVAYAVMLNLIALRRRGGSLIT